MPEASKRLDQAPSLENDTLVTRDIVLACQRGEEIAQKRLFEICLPTVQGLAVRIVGRQDADDVSQQSFLQVFRRIGSFQGNAQFSTWLYRLVVNECLQHLRKNKRNRRCVSLGQEPMDERPAFDSEADHKELLERAMSRLSPDMRTLLVMREIEKLSYKEIGNILDIAEGTVASRLNQARAQLKEHLTDLGWEP